MLEVGDKCWFLWKGRIRFGEVCIKDMNTFFEPGVHYDVYVERDNTLYKHLCARDVYRCRLWNLFCAIFGSS